MPELFTTPAAPTTYRTCVACGGPLDSCGPDGYWLHDTQPHHAQCVPWKEKEFPFVWAADQGRRTMGRLQRLEIPYTPKLVKATKWLEGIPSIWVPPDVVAVLRRAAVAARVVDRWACIAREATRTSNPSRH